MGNIITNDNGTIIDSKLKDVIFDWAINDYDAGLNYKQTTKIRKLLLKRACCIKNPDMIIGLPKFTVDNNIIDVDASNYSPITIENIYNEVNYDTRCNNIDNAENADYRQPSGYEKPSLPENTSAVTMTHACKVLYEGETLNKGLCKNIKLDREKQSDDENVIAYGVYDDDTLNVYSDCNCLNSVLRNKNPKLFVNGVAQYNPNILAQMLDPKCSTLDYVYNYKLETVENLCINANELPDMTISNNAKVTVSQNCNFSSTTDNANDVPSSSSSTSSQTLPSSSSTSSQTLPSSSSSTTITKKILTPINIIIFVSIIVITLILMMVFKIKYFVH